MPKPRTEHPTPMAKRKKKTTKKKATKAASKRPKKIAPAAKPRTKSEVYKGKSNKRRLSCYRLYCS